LQELLRLEKLVLNEYRKNTFASTSRMPIAQTVGWQHVPGWRGAVTISSGVAGNWRWRRPVVHAPHDCGVGLGWSSLNFIQLFPRTQRPWT